MCRHSQTPARAASGIRPSEAARVCASEAAWLAASAGWSSAGFGDSRWGGVALGELDPASLQSHAIYVTPGGRHLAFSRRELTGDGYDYLLPIRSR